MSEGDSNLGKIVDPGKVLFCVFRVIHASEDLQIVFFQIDRTQHFQVNEYLTAVCKCNRILVFIRDLPAVDDIGCDTFIFRPYNFSAVCPELIVVFNRPCIGLVGFGFPSLDDQRFG